MADIHDNRKYTCITCQIRSYFKTETLSPMAVKSVGGFLWLSLKNFSSLSCTFYGTLNILTLTTYYKQDIFGAKQQDFNVYSNIFCEKNRASFIHSDVELCLPSPPIFYKKCMTERLSIH